MASGRARLRSALRLISVLIVSCLWPSLATADAELDLETRPIAIDNAGAVRFVAGWEVAADHPDFGGLSGLLLHSETARAVTDRGSWVVFDLTRDPDGVISAIPGARIGPIVDAAGQPLEGRSADAEAMAMGMAGLIMVGFEGGHRIVGYPAPSLPVLLEPKGPPADALANNGGIEALARAPDGALIAIAEDPAQGAGPEIAGWRLMGDEVARFQIDRLDGYAPTGADFGPDGALYIVERRYRWFSGVAVRLRRFDTPDFPSGDLGRGEVLATLGAAAGVDNFEAIVAEPTGEGDVLLTLLSDDNFSALQRTLIAQFIFSPTRASIE